MVTILLAILIEYIIDNFTVKGLLLSEGTDVSFTTAFVVITLAGIETLITLISLFLLLEVLYEFC